MLSNQIIQKLEEIKYLPAKITAKSHFYTDLGLDSLAFIKFLVLLEEEYNITFEFAEMEHCLQVGHLIATVENKLSR